MANVPDYLKNVNFDQVAFNSILNPQSNTSDIECNIDKCIDSRCKYFDNDSLNSTLHNHSDISIFHHNARSLNKNSTNIVDYIASLDIHFDIYCFTETWFKSIDDANLIDIDGYTPESCIRDDRTGGGASIFINSKFNYIKRSDLKIDCVDCDSVFIEIPLKHGNIVIGVIYKTQTVILEDFFSGFERTLDTINKEKKRCYLAGDFNLDLLKHESCSKVSAFINMPVTPIKSPFLSLTIFSQMIF